MAFISGILLIDAPASALNNGEGEDTKGRVKKISVPGQGDFPYVSAQSFRFWLRNSMRREFPELPDSPVYSPSTGKQQAFTAGDPLTYWDDDLLGYMRAEKKETVTRISPFRTGTVVSIAPVRLVEDFGVMSRAPKAEGDKEGVILHGHDFYRAVLVAPFSIDLARAGTFTDVKRPGYQNLGESGRKAAEAAKLPYDEATKSFRLPLEERVKRVSALLRSLVRLDGGAKQTLHYTDVTPAFVMAAVVKGGNNLFGRVIKAERSVPQLHEGALAQVTEVFKEDLHSAIYVGRAKGFMDSAGEVLSRFSLTVEHPRTAFDKLAADLANHPEWWA